MEKPILFSGEMVRAILDGRKTQTRRVVNPQPTGGYLGFIKERLKHWFKHEPSSIEIACPYGRPGDLLWVRETWASHKYMDDTKPSEFTVGAQMLPVWYRADNVQSDERGKWRPSIFMPRWASRITLRVVDVRVETLWDMTVSKMTAEGVAEIENNDKHPLTPFITLWDSINADRGHAWYTNPWVWVVEFEEVS